MTNPKKSKPVNDNICSYKCAFMLDNWIRKLVHNPTRIVGEYVGEGDTVIDLGCGPGFFSVEMAKMVGPKGKVYAVDLQEEMLDYVKRNAVKKQVTDRIQYHKCESDRLGLELKETADFILAYYVVHETPDPRSFFQEVKALLKKGGKFLVVEPRWHVKREKFEKMIRIAGEEGFEVEGYPKRKGGRTVLLKV